MPTFSFKVRRRIRRFFQRASAFTLFCVWGTLLGGAATFFTSDQMRYWVGTNPILSTVKFAEQRSVQDYVNGVANGSTNNLSAFTSALGAARKVIVPGSSSCYQFGTTGLVISSSGRTLEGEGMGSPGNGPTCIQYTGTGCAITVDSAHNVTIRNLDIQVNSASATAAGLCFKATTTTNEFNTVENVSISNVGTARTAGQVGLALLDFVSGVAGNGIYWNHFRNLRFKSWDTSLVLQGGHTQGANANVFMDLMSYAHVLAIRLIGEDSTHGNVSDNRFYGIHCSRSDGTYFGTSTCMNLGDDGSTVFDNYVYGLINDSAGIGVSVCGQLGINTGANTIQAGCESGGGFADNQISGASPPNSFPNLVYNSLGLGSIVNRFAVGNLVSTKGAQIIFNSLNGLTGGGTAGAGANVFVRGGDGNSNLVGGDVSISGGNAGAGTAAAGSVLVTPGVRQGATVGGTFTAGPSSGQGASGFRVRSSRVVIASKPFVALDCAGAGISVTISNLLDRSLFTCGTAQTITLPSAQGSGGIVQALPGQGVSTFAGGPTLVGDQFEFTIVSTAATNFTLAGNTGITLVGNPVINNRAARVLCEVTSVGVGTETMSCYL